MRITHPVVDFLKAVGACPPPSPHPVAHSYRFLLCLPRRVILRLCYVLPCHAVTRHNTVQANVITTRHGTGTGCVVVSRVVCERESLSARVNMCVRECHSTFRWFQRRLVWFHPPVGWLVGWW